MGKKKKSLANKLAKMSDDDRARYLQHKADQEEELKRRKEQLINIFLKNKVKREDAFARLNIAKINQNWHNLLRKIKTKSLKSDVEFLNNRIEHLLKLKNKTIDTLMDELDTAEEDYKNNYQRHMNSIAKIIDFSSKAVQDIKDQHDSELKDLLRKGQTERTNFYEILRDQEIFIRSLINEHKILGKRSLRENYDYYFKIKDDVMIQNKKEFDELRKSKEKEMTLIWSKILQVLREHILETDKKRAHLAELHTLDLQSGEEIMQNESLITKKQKELKKLETNFTELKTDSEREKSVLNDYNKILKENYEMEKQKLHNLLQTDETNLLFLSENSNSTLKFLEKQQKQRENILNLVQICRKFETQEEKVLKFVEFVPCTIFDDFSEDISEDDENLSPSLPRSMQHSFETTKKMSKFWKCYSKTLMSLKDMQKEEELLKKENETLKNQLKLVFEAKIYTEIDKESKEITQKQTDGLFITFSADLKKGKRIIC